MKKESSAVGMVRKLIAVINDELNRHMNGCGCRDGTEMGSRGLCPGQAEMRRAANQAEALIAFLAEQKR